MSASENVLVGLQPHLPCGFWSSLFNVPARQREERDAKAETAALLDFVGLLNRAHEPAGSLPYGLQRRLEIARALATHPRLLLLDEPAAGLNPQETQDLIGLIQATSAKGTRAVEAGAHAYAARSGRYASLTSWEVTAEGHLSGVIELPMAVGLIGGATKLHPIARLALKILNVASAAELARLIAAIRLAQNFSALKVLATTGVQKGHMSLHSHNIAMMAGAVGEEVDKLAKILVAKGGIRIDIAEKELALLRAK